MGFAAGFAAGLAVGLKKGGGTPAEEEWQPPSDWLTVPEPEPWEIYFLIDVLDENNYNYYNFSLYFANPNGPATPAYPSYPYYGETERVYIRAEWGDGSEDTIIDSNVSSTAYFRGQISHNYTEKGQYIVKTTVAQTTCVLVSGGNTYNPLIAKLGSKIRANYNENSSGRDAAFFESKNKLHWLLVNGEQSHLGVRDLASCTMLRKVDFKIKISGNIPQEFFRSDYFLKFGNNDFPEVLSIGLGAFGYCYSIKTINLPECTSIEQQAFEYCINLERVYAPKCTSVGQKAFQYCYNLKEVVFSDECTFGENAFSQCLSLYPHPDGSTN